MQLGDPESHQVPFEFDRAAWAAQNDRFRAKAHEFLNKSGVTPRDEVCALRMCIMPVQEMEKREFWVGSRKHELQQQGVAARANLLDGHLDGSNLLDGKLQTDFQAGYYPVSSPWKEELTGFMPRVVGTRTISHDMSDRFRGMDTRTSRCGPQ